MKMRIYIDTSVIGGCLDEEFKDSSLKLFKAFKRSEKIPVISDMVLFELEEAPEEVKEILATLPNDLIDYVGLSEESINLATAYITEKALPEQCLLDARHIAIATVERVDVLVSWNFKHIVNLNRIHQINSVNMKLGYPLLEIRSPREVIDEEK